MAGEGLRELLARVHEHLKGGAPVEPEVRAQLGTVLRDIERTLASDAGAASSGSGPALERLAVRFEASHPALAERLREVLDALGKAGI
jgi:hypothetical protein